MKLFWSALTFCIVVSMFSSPLVYAGPGKIVPYVSVSQEYSDNYRFLETNEVEEFVTTLTGGLNLLYNSERTNARLNGKIYHLFHWDNDQLDATDGGVNGSVQHQLTERFGLGASADYSRDSRRDADTETTGLILNGDREKINGSLNSSFMFSETLSIQVTGGYGIVDIEESNLDEDDASISANISLTKNLSKTFKNTTGLLTLSYLNYSSDIDTVVGTGATYYSYLEYESDVFQLYTGFSKNITELYSFYLQAGASYTRTSENRLLVFPGVGEVPTPESKNDTWGGVLLSGLNYDGLYWDVGLSLSHDVRGSSGSNGTVERSAVSLDISRQIAEKFTASLAASCYLNKNERTTQADLEELTYNISPKLSYRFWDTFSLSALYRYTNIEDRTANTNKERNLFLITLRKKFEL